MYTYICENSIDGFLTGIYTAYADRHPLRDIHLSVGEGMTLSLFTQYIEVTPDPVKAAKVANTLKSRFGQDFYETIYQAAMSGDVPGKSTMDKADAIFETIALALSSGDGTSTLLSLGEPCVYRVFELCRATGREAMHLLGFVRFQELENGILFSEIHPKHHVLPILGDHFSDRLPEENFMIYDENRRLALLHPAKQHYFLADVKDLNMDMIRRFSADETHFEQLWITFFRNITIEARKNPHLQSQMIPKRFQQDAVEFQAEQQRAASFY